MTDQRVVQTALGLVEVAFPERDQSQPARDHPSLDEVFGDRAQDAVQLTRFVKVPTEVEVREQDPREVGDLFGEPVPSRSGRDPYQVRALAIEPGEGRFVGRW
ncbi:MAG TPA: hypothetical protein VG674_30800 [Amycolatopsis sp.]|nr:hypothetical protein [Amycolatopsis sp.]